jgi:hypothetical protein
MRQQFRILGQVAVGVHRFKQAGKLYESRRRAVSVDVGSVASINAQLSAEEQEKLLQQGGGNVGDGNARSEDNNGERSRLFVGVTGDAISNAKRAANSRSLSLNAAGNVGARVNVDEFLKQMKANNPTINTKEILDTSGKSDKLDAESDDKSGRVHDDSYSRIEVKCEN